MRTFSRSSFPPCGCPDVDAWNGFTWAKHPNHISKAGAIEMMASFRWILKLFFELTHILMLADVFKTNNWNSIWEICFELQNGLEIFTYREILQNSPAGFWVSAGHLPPMINSVWGQKMFFHRAGGGGNRPFLLSKILQSVRAPSHWIFVLGTNKGRNPFALIAWQKNGEHHQN